MIRGDRIIESLANNNIITPEGAEWIKAALDPFHDTDVNCKGFPDIVVSPSVVQLVKVTASISCPSAITTGTWDVNIFQLPWFTTEPVDLWTKTNQVIYSPVNASITLGGITAVAVQSGTSTAYGVAGTHFLTPLSVADSYFDGPARVIAGGMEIVNTTAELNLQGLVTVYRQPLATPLAQEGWCISSPAGATPILGSFTGPSISYWPSTQANAMLLTGSRQWAAKEGNYSVFSLNSMTLPVSGENYIQPVMMTDEVNGGTATSALTPAATGSGPYTFEPMALQPYNMSGAFYTGLSLSTTLQITMNLFIERFPDPTEADLAPLAKPSPGFDPECLKLYSLALCNLPPGVMVKDNGLGDWFMDTVGKVASFAAPVLKSIPLPMTQMAGMAAEAFATGRSDPGRRIERGQTPYAAKKTAAVMPPSSYIDPASVPDDYEIEGADLGYERGWNDAMRKCQAKQARKKSRKGAPKKKKSKSRRRR